MGIQRVSRMVLRPDSNPLEGKVRWSFTKSAWIGSMTIIAILGGIPTLRWDAFLLFAITSILTLCSGHSVGMHRRLIHNSFDCPRWLEYGLVYSGTLMGMAGPFSIIQMHELRDWAQRQPHCHDYFASRQPLLRDYFWILYCEIQLRHPPEIRYEARLVNDRFYQMLERSRHWHQLPWAILFYGLGGWSYVIWGICVRITVCMTGHWFMGYLAHRWGNQQWRIEGAGVQGYNVRFCGLITMGECWHNNHHAYPDSAQIGLERYQSDPGWWMILALERLGWAWNILRPQDLGDRPERKRLKPDAVTPLFASSESSYHPRA